MVKNVAKTIAVSDEVYELLKRFKLPGESFSDAIKRAIKRGGRLMDIAGTKTITKEEWELVEKAMRKIRAIEIEKKKELIKKMQSE